MVFVVEGERRAENQMRGSIMQQVLLVDGLFHRWYTLYDACIILHNHRYNYIIIL